MAAETFLNGRVTLHAGDSRDVLKTIPDCSIDSIVTDPPYALVSIVKRFGADNAAAVKVPEGGSGAYARASSGFMGRKWDTGETAFDPKFWVDVLRVLKPGGHVVAFSGTRTVHRMTCAIEDAGFEIRDNVLDMIDSTKRGSDFLESLNDEQRSAFVQLIDDSAFTGLLGWAYGSGFPKSHDVSKGIDRTLGAERAKIRIPASELKNPPNLVGGAVKGDDRPWRESAMERGFHEAVSDEAVSDEAVEWQGWGTALKPAWEPIVLARKPLGRGLTVAANVLKFGTGAINIDGCRVGADGGTSKSTSKSTTTSVGSYLNAGAGEPIDAGRWPANIIHDDSPEVVAAFPVAPGQQFYVGPEHGDRPSRGIYGDFGARPPNEPRNDSGSAARFFYASKADSDDRLGSKHPTIKNIDQIQWLCRLVTPPGGTICDPFAGSGTCGEAAFREGFNAILIEREPEYQADIRRRMGLVLSGPDERSRESIKARLGDAAPDHGPLFGGLDTPPRRAGESTEYSRTNNRTDRTEMVTE